MIKSGFIKPYCTGVYSMAIGLDKAFEAIVKAQLERIEASNKEEGKRAMTVEERKKLETALRKRQRAIDLLYKNKIL